MKLLYESGADPEAVGYDGDMVMTLAVTQRDAAAVKALIEAGSERPVRDT
ncbi:MAG: ankyrin repeat domain-containing protein [Boseongicola sp. SB0662_bin_57]|nr:ankyrin repeat domain-containing protein [Boseongicola sp. SB0662_bin_57]